jgi:hypothetical protein
MKILKHKKVLKPDLFQGLSQKPPLITVNDLKKIKF